MKGLALLLATGKFSKLLLTAGTMLLSILAYSLVYGWYYALGLVALIFIHEMGHYIAARQRGIEVGAPTFIPFVGAWIELKDKPQNAETDAFIGLGGPLLGTLAAIGCYFIGRHTAQPIWLALSYAGFFLNLFNLIPLPPFDGGRITSVISSRIWLLGIPILIGAFFYRPNPLLIFMAILAAPQIIQSFQKNPASLEQPSDSAISLEHKVEYTFYYLSLVVFLAIMTGNVYEMLEKSPF
ncbi:MAG: site-2 protease family protein [Pseudomonadota bacterium]